MSGTTVLTVAYDGAPFSGFARQEGTPTVQALLEGALATVLRREVAIVGAGRTDAGVHALGQVVSFASREGDAPAAKLARSLGALCAPAIVVREVREAREGFSARFDAVSREYRYRIVCGATPPVFVGRVAWHVARDLDAGAMREAAAALVGEHDFRSFCVTSSAAGRDTVRRMLALEVTEDEPLGERCLVVGAVGNAFLHSMVRVIVGSLVEVGRGARSADWLANALQARDRAAAGPTAPAHGLTLWRVEYPPDAFTDAAAEGI